MTNVFVAIYEHRYGTDARVFATEAGGAGLERRASARALVRSLRR